MPASPTEPSAPAPSSPGRRLMLRIDGVGSWLVCLGDRVTVGGPAFDGGDADVPLLAGLSRRHAAFVRSGEGYFVEAHGFTRVAHRPVEGRAHLADGYEVELGASVRLRFRQPTVLSATAVLEFVSDHRPPQHVDGAILMDETCLLGPGRDKHVPCPDWDETVLLYRKGGEFRCKSRGELLVAGRSTGADAAFRPGEIVTGTNFRFYLEPVA